MGVVILRVKEQGMSDCSLHRNACSNVAGVLHQPLAAISTNERQVDLTNLGQHTRRDLIQVRHLHHGIPVVSLAGGGQGERQQAVHLGLTNSNSDAWWPSQMFATALVRSGRPIGSAWSSR